MIEHHLARIRFRHALSLEEEAAIRAIVPPARHVRRHSVVVREGQHLETSTLLLEGILCRYKDLLDGNRQIIQLHVPGDFADLHAFTLKRLEHNIQAATDCMIASVPHDDIRQLIERWPRVGRLYWFSTNLDASINREWEVWLGQRSAAARLAALFCEVHVRLQVIGQAGTTFTLGMNQIELADSLGMTSVHINRTLRLLRDQRLLAYRRGQAEILDLDGLKSLAAFDPTYLYLNPDPL